MFARYVTLLHSRSYTIIYIIYIYICVYYKKVYLNRISYTTFLVYNGYVGHFFREEIIKIQLSFTLLI